jgi:hypothetical protein
MSMSSDIGYLIPVSSITLHVNISPCSDKTWRACVIKSHTIMDKSTRALLIFGMDGKQQHTYQYDSNKHRLFTLPHRITTNNNKDIVVVDSTLLYMSIYLLVQIKHGGHVFYSHTK